VGSAVALALGDADVDVPVRRFGIPEQFLSHAKRGEVLADIGLTPVDIAGRISACLAGKAAVEKGALMSARGASSTGASASQGDPIEAEPVKETPQ
jgi:1-deoxy-D-xylulose-5-phosphate synthase